MRPFESSLLPTHSDIYAVSTIDDLWESLGHMSM